MTEFFVVTLQKIREYDIIGAEICNAEVLECLIKDICV